MMLKPISFMRFGGGAVSPFAAYAANSVTPELVADFSNATPFFGYASAASDFDTMFTTGTTGLATTMDSDGNLKWSAHNLLPYSEDFTDAAWTDTSLNIGTLALDATGPDGVANSAVTFVDSGATGTGFVRLQDKGITVENSTSYTYSCYMKADQLSWGFLRINNFITPANGGVYFNLSTGTVGAEDTGITGSIEDVGSGWYRCSITFTTDATDTSGDCQIYLASADDTNTVDLDGTSSILIYGAHFYRSDLGGMVNNPDSPIGTPDSYVPTSGAAVYLPRRDSYYGPTPTKGGLRFESAAATNLITYSEDFTDGMYFAGGLLTPSADTVGPDGVTNSAYTIVDDSTGGTNNNRLVATLPATATSTAYTASIYAKADGNSFLFLAGYLFTTPATGGVWFNLSTGAVGTVDTGFAATIEDVGGGWYRCAITFTTDAADTSGQLRVVPADSDGVVNSVSDGTASIKIYGAQFEAGSFPTSYIPTAGATATRALETLDIAGANTPANTSAMSFAMNGLVTYTDNNLGGSGAGRLGEAIFFDWFSTINLHMELILRTETTNTGAIEIISDDGVVDGVISTADYTPGVNVAFSGAAYTTSGSMNVAKDGTAATANTTPTGLPDLSTKPIKLGYKFNGFIFEFIMWGADIGDTGIEAAST